MIRSKWRRSFQSRGVSGLFCCLVWRWEASLADGAFGVYVFVEGGAGCVDQCVLVVLVECVGGGFVAP